MTSVHHWLTLWWWPPTIPTNSRNRQITSTNWMLGNYQQTNKQTNTHTHTQILLYLVTITPGGPTHPSCAHKSSPFLPQYITAIIQEREGENSKSGVSGIAMEQERGLPQNTTNIHHLVSCSPVLSSLWSIGTVSSTHSLQVCSSSQYSAIKREKSTIIQPQTHLASYYFLVLFTQGDPHILLWCTKNLHKFSFCQCSAKKLETS